MITNGSVSKIYGSIRDGAGRPSLSIKLIFFSHCQNTQSETDQHSSWNHMQSKINFSKKENFYQKSQFSFQHFQESLEKWKQASKSKSKSFALYNLMPSQCFSKEGRIRWIISISLHSADITGGAMPNNPKPHFHQQFTLIHWSLPLDTVFCSSDLF